MRKRSKRTWIILATLLVACMLTVAPLPVWADPWRPPWVVVVMIYWCLAIPDRVGVLFGWCVGLILDVLVGSVLGQHALGLALVCYIASFYHTRVRVFPLAHQSIFVASLCFFYLLLMWQIHGALGSTLYDSRYLFGAVSAGLFWPWIYVVLRDIRRRAKVS